MNRLVIAGLCAAFWVCVVGVAWWAWGRIQAKRRNRVMWANIDKARGKS